MIKSKVAVVTTGFLGLLSADAYALESDFVTNGKVIKFTREDGKVLGKVSSKDFKNNNIKTNGNFRGVFKNGFDVENVDYNNPVNSAVGLLHNELDDSFYMGSGMFISPTVFVTVAHNFLQPNGVNQLDKNVRQYNIILGSNSKANANRVTSGISYLYPPQTIKFWNKDGFSLKPSEVEGNTRKSDGALVGGANIQWFNDLAVLTFDKPMQLMSPYKMADFNELASEDEFNNIREGDKVNVLGYSSDFDKSDDALLENKLEHGKLYKISGAIQGYIDPTTGKPYEKFIDKNGNLVDNPNKSVFYNYITSRGGLSGAGVLNNKNHVIGLHQFALDGKYHSGHAKAGESVPDSDPSNKQAGGIIFTKEQRDWLRQVIEQNKITGWYEDSKSGERYFFKDDGHMLCNTTKVIDGVTYRFDGFGVAKAQTEVAKKQGSVKVKYLVGTEEVLPSKVVVSGDVGTKYSYSTVNDNELINLLEKGKYELVESINQEEVLTEGEHVINVSVRLKTSNTGSNFESVFNALIEAEKFLKDKKSVNINHSDATSYNANLIELRKLVDDARTTLNITKPKEVIDNMNRILSEKLDMLKLEYNNMTVDVRADRNELVDKVKKLVSIKRDISGLSSDEEKELRKLLSDISSSVDDVFNSDDINEMSSKTHILSLKYNELLKFDEKLKNLQNEHDEKVKLIKEWKQIALGNVSSLPSSIKSNEVNKIQNEIKILSSDLNVSTDETLDVIKKKVADKKRLSELINQNNILVSDLINKAKNNNSNNVDESTKPSDKVDNSTKDTEVVKPDSNKVDDSTKDTNKVKPSDKVDESTKDTEVVKPDSNKVDDSTKDTNKVKPSDKVDNSTKDTEVVKPDSNKVDDSTKPIDKVDESTKDSNKVDNSTKDTDVVKPTDKVDKSAKDTEIVKPTDKVDNSTKDTDKLDENTKVIDKVDDSTKPIDKVDESTKDNDKVDNSTKDTEVVKPSDKVDNTKVDIKIKKVPLVLKDIVISETPVIKLNEKFDFTIKYDEQMLDIDENVQKINLYNNIHANTKTDDENINFILNYLSKLKK
jgi:hypothetical protein